MKKKISLSILAGILVLILLFVFYPQGNKRSQYKIDAVFNPAHNSLVCTENVTYYNNSDVALKQIYFHIFPNAFLDTDIIEKSGKIDITRVTINTSDIEYQVLGADNTLLKLSLKKQLKPGRKVVISIAFNLIIPYRTFGDRFSYNKYSYNLGNWYPIAAVYDKKGWNLDPYYTLGDPFYSETADYNVNITTPKEYIIAATGNQEDVKSNIKNKTYNFKQDNVRDFAMVISDKFKVKQEKVDGINIKCYYLDGTNEKNQFAMKVAKDSIKIYNQYYGMYPYDNYSVVATPFFTGMEYPGLVYINRDYYTKNSTNKILETTIAHETAHQWWYGVVGNNEVDEAWLDESFATYSEVLYYEKEYNKELGRKYYESRVYTPLDINSKQEGYKENVNDYISKLQSDVIVRSIPRFDSEEDYVRLVYKKGATVLGVLRNKMGDKAFFKMMSQYYKDNKFKVVETEDFIKKVEKVTDEKWDSFFKNALYDKHIELMVNDTKPQKWYEKIGDNVLRKLGFSKYSEGQTVKMKYFEAIFSDDWNNTEADEFAAANTKNFVRWTAHVTYINNEKLLTLREGELPEIWVAFNNDTIKKNKIHVGDLITIKGNLEEYRHSNGYVVAYKPPAKDPPQWVVVNCKIEKTTALEKKELAEYLKKDE